MPNWITNKITATPSVIKAMMNDEGLIDFNKIAPFTGPHTWDLIRSDAEHVAQMAIDMPVDSHPLIGALQQMNRRGLSMETLDKDGQEQAKGMIENHKACGYLHRMDFARAIWGTKWNACDSIANPDNGTCQFETAWSCPIPVLILLSKQFPAEPISVVYADEDLGSNCGTILLQNGEIVAEDTSPGWSRMDEAARKKWKAFACSVKGIDPVTLDD